MAFVKLLSVIRRLAAALPYLLLHLAFGMFVAALLGGVEVFVRIAILNPRSANEFVGLYWVVAVYLVGPVACTLAVPVHLFWYFRLESSGRQHVYSVCSSVALYMLVWALVYLAFPG